MELIAFLVLVVVVGAAGFVVAVQRRDRRPSDRDVLERLRQDGADLSKAHSVEFFLHFPTREIALRIAEAVSADGFKASVGPGVGSRYQIVLAAKEMVPVASELAAIGKRFTALAASEGGSYEGWAATAVSSRDGG